MKTLLFSKNAKQSVQINTTSDAIVMLTFRHCYKVRQQNEQTFQISWNKRDLAVTKNKNLKGEENYSLIASR